MEREAGESGGRNREENGYQVKVFQLYCPTNKKTDMGEVTFVKTIEGKDRFYVVDVVAQDLPSDGL